MRSMFICKRLMPYILVGEVSDRCQTEGVSF